MLSFVHISRHLFIPWGWADVMFSIFFSQASGIPYQIHMLFLLSKASAYGGLWGPGFRPPAFLSAADLGVGASALSQGAREEEGHVRTGDE